MQSVATVLGANNLTKGLKSSEIEKRILNFAESIKDEDHWKCDEDIEGIKKLDQMSLLSSLNHQGMPQRIIDNVKSDISLTACVKAVKRFLESPKEAWCLVLSGPKGCGKSTAAAHYLWEKTSKCKSDPPKDMRWWTAARVARVSGFNADLEKMMKVPLMVIDDLGVEYLDKNGYFSHRLDELIDERYSNYRQTIITTNLNARDFQDRYGERVTSRIKEGFKHGNPENNTWFVHVNEKSLR